MRESAYTVFWLSSSSSAFFSIFSLMLLSSCHARWLWAKKGSFLSSLQCRGWRTRRMWGGERGGRGRILGPGWGLRSLNIHAEEERSTPPNLQLHHTAFETTPSAFCLMHSSLFFPHLPPLYPPPHTHTHTHTLFTTSGDSHGREYTHTRWQKHTHKHTCTTEKNHTSAKILTHSIQGLTLSALQPLLLNWLTNSDFASLLTTRERYRVYPYPHTHTHTHTLKIHTLLYTEMFCNLRTPYVILLIANTHHH